MTKINELRRKMRDIIEWLSDRFYSKGRSNRLINQRLKRELDEVAIWKVSLHRFEQDIELEEAKFAFDQAEKLLGETIDEGQQIITRTSIVMTISGAALVFLGGHIGALLSGKNIRHIQNIDTSAFIRYHLTFIPACLLAFVLVYLLFRLSLLLRGWDYYSIGSQPKDLLVRQYYSGHEKDLSILTQFYLGELENYQIRITGNISRNERRWAQVNDIIFSLISNTVIACFLLLVELLLCL